MKALTWLRAAVVVAAVVGVVGLWTFNHGYLAIQQEPDRVDHATCFDADHPDGYPCDRTVQGGTTWDLGWYPSVLGILLSGLLAAGVFIGVAALRFAWRTLAAP